MLSDTQHLEKQDIQHSKPLSTLFSVWHTTDSQEFTNSWITMIKSEETNKNLNLFKRKGN